MNLSKKQSILKHTLIYASANYVVQALGMVNSIALRRFLGPQAMGIWSFLQVILGYCGYASLGTSKAMARDYPYLRGRGDHGRAETLKDLTMTFSMIMSFIPAAACLVYLVARWSSMAAPLRAGLAFITLFLFIQRFYDLIITLLRSDKKFEFLSRLIVIHAAGGLLVTFLLVHAWNLYGLLAGTAILMAVSIWYIYRCHPYRFQWYWNHRELLNELKLGLPLVISTFLFEFLMSLDKLIIVNRLGFYALGLYSIALMVSQYIYSLPMMFSHIWYPNLMEDYGANHHADGVRHYLLSPISVLRVVIPFLCGLAIFTLPVLVDFFLPKFREGLGVMNIYLIGTFFVMLAEFSNKFLVALNKYLLPIPFLAAAVVLNAVLNLSFIHTGWGVKGVALGAVVSFSFYGVAVYVLALKQVLPWRDIFGHLSKLFGFLFYFLSVILILEHNLRLESGLTEALLKVVLFTILTSPFLWHLERRNKLFSHLWQIITRKSPPREGFAVPAESSSADE